ncbi:hypothetical protein JXA80_04850 [bacterium]|nr:hypothetical protein [candidate division CSSED10-310 bacterium]
MRIVSVRHEKWMLVGLVIGSALLSCGFWGKSKKDIDVKGVHSIAVTPFTYTKFKNFSSLTGEIVPATMYEVFDDKLSWECIALDRVTAAMKEMGVDAGGALTEQQARNLGKTLGADLVIYGSLPVYDEHESSRDIPLTAGRMMTENIRELRVEFDFSIVRCAQEETPALHLLMDELERDTAKDPMMPDPPEQQLRHATRRMTKDLIKRFITE